ncbi:hypothetical protein [Pseudomonas chlororaphis]|uniref:Uncharacterized protein n=1 Tax=Pseudomonas chlororaphis TaxID=587753 RepID=A0AAX3FRL1_9PSED|nr:hypothetical protein [Pseudomonas chlororaphis]AZC38223.1 hypothetical protein C4K37_3838 [Pseudomonas chlororaphis subsp. piscium]AZC44771.1 hypothetical protein C4K36_3848 [Pseudomonas chlororaphis subsp. piscium]WDG70376.1 hypothetical protein PUP65_19895 [Pseudomonas chlororaphis]WDH31837.1 hypothetical protein PUP81_14425 [Pseudomonas chlororaphis]WDH68902.1 hypothetical protein PUP78_19880 [Pseudomonas chlororaphis]
MSDNNMLPAKAEDLIHFDSLLEQGMEAIEQYSGQVWTDKGEQDPGVTLLQDLSYGVSDLAYRHTLPLVDLLTPTDTPSGGGVFPAQFGPHRVLTCGPVTVDDYRRALLDLHSSDAGETPGGFYFRNVQLTRESAEEQYQYWYDPDPDKREFTFARPVSNTEPTQLTLKGNYHLYVELARGADKTKAQTALDAFLKANRNLCEAVRETTWVEPQLLQLFSTLELEDDCTDYDRVLAELYMLSEAYLSPMAARAAASGLSEQGVANEAIYQGPQLSHGWMTQLPAARDYNQSVEVDLSPLVNTWLSIDGVKSITLLGYWADGYLHTNWRLSIEANKYLQLWGDNPVSYLTSNVDFVHLYKKGQRCSSDSSAIKKHITTVPLITEQDVVMPYGRNRKPAEFHSLSNRLPPCYGLQQPLPGDTQKQLHQFLLPFEQILANGCQQLALLPDLLAFDRSQPSPVWGEQWPFAAYSLSDKVHQAYKPTLSSLLDGYKQDDSKELATIDYLLGYFGSQRAPRTLSSPLSDFLKVQRGYLSQHADLGYQRSNIQIQAVSALQKRIAARIGIGSALFDQSPALDKLPFYLVEHRALLPALPDEHYNAEQTPMAATSDQQNKNLLLTVAVSADHPLHVGLLIDLIIKDGGGSGNDYILPTVMVKAIDSTGAVLTCSMQDNEQLARNLDKVIEAMKAGTLRWKNSNVWLHDMWYPLSYGDAKNLKEGEKRIVETHDAPYPVMLQKSDQIAIRYHISPNASLLEDDKQSIIHAQVVPRDWINGSFVIKAKDGSTLPEEVANYRWYIDDQGKTLSDRFSFMVSLVFPRSLLAGLTDACATEAWIKQCILDEIPCHISALVHWLDDSAFAQFGVTYQGWQNDGAPLGDRSYQLLKQLTLGRTPGVLDGIRHMRIAKSAQQQAATEPGWNPDYISENELFYVPKN